MKKICCMQVAIVLIALVATSVMPMEELINSLLPVKTPGKPLIDNSNVVLFTGDFSIVTVEKSNLPLIKALYPEYQKHKKLADNGGIIPSFQITEGLSLVNEALKVRPDEFVAYYTQLGPNNRQLLVQASGQYDDKGLKTMLNVPEITKRLIDALFDPDLRKKIKSYFKKDDEDVVHSYLRERLITNKGLLMLKEPIFGKRVSERLRDDIYLGSLFIDAGNTINQYDYPIFLTIGDVIRKTYATHFGIDNHEYRVTDVDDNQCILWAINHDTSATLSTPIRLKGAIKGCRISNTQTKIEYAVIYSKHDMVLAEINKETGAVFVELINVAMPEKSTIVDVCFEPIDTRWIVGLYEGLASVFRMLNRDGKIGPITHSLRFKKHGLLGKIIIYKKMFNQYVCAAMLGVADQYAIVTFESQADGSYNYAWDTGLKHVSLLCDTHCSGFKMALMGSRTHMYADTAPFFMKNVQAQQIKNTTVTNNSFFGYISDVFSSAQVQPESEVHRVYSPDGAFLMCNSLKKKLGILFVETVLKDAVTHKQIVSIDTLYNDFGGVGFTPDGADLIFLDGGMHNKVSLLSDKDKRMLYEIEKVAFASCGVTSLLKRLCIECKEKGIITLHKGSPTHRMLMDWAKVSPLMLDLLMICFPVRKI